MSLVQFPRISLLPSHGDSSQRQQIDTNAHFMADGTRPEMEDAANYHDLDPLVHRPPQGLQTWSDLVGLIKERGQTRHGGYCEVS